MSADPVTPGPDQPPSDGRNARGEWRPPYPIRYSPLFSWPLRAAAIFRWLFGWPGFMWPVNLSLLLLSTVSWYLTQPAITRCVDFEFGWIAQIWLRNQVMMWLYYGAFHYYLYIRKGEGLNNLAEFVARRTKERSPDFGRWLEALDDAAIADADRIRLMSDLRNTLESMSGARPARSGFVCY